MGERFLDSSTHLYKRVCPSVHPSVRPLVRPSVRQSDRNSFFFQIRENTYFLIPRSLGGRGWQGKGGGGDDGARGGDEGCQGGGEGVTKGADASEVWRDQTCSKIIHCHIFPKILLRGSQQYSSILLFIWIRSS